MMTMESTNTIPNEVAMAVIADKCRVDQELARALQADGKAALSGLSGESIADDVSVNVVQNTPERVHVVLPEYAGQEDWLSRSSLSDEEMKDLSGGEVFITLLVVGGVLAGSAVVAGTIIGVAESGHI